MICRMNKAQRQALNELIDAKVEQATISAMTRLLPLEYSHQQLRAINRRVAAAESVFESLFANPLPQDD